MSHCFETPYMRQKNYKSLIKNIQKHNIYIEKKFWKKNSSKKLNGLTQWRLQHISNFRQTLKTKLRPKSIIFQNLLKTLKFCSFSNFHCSSTRFAVHLLPFVSIRFCKFEQNCSTGYDFIRKSLGPVFFKQPVYFTLHILLRAVTPKFLFFNIGCDQNCSQLSST